MGATQSSSFRETTSTELSFVNVLITIIIAWILVTLWADFIRNLSYSTFKLDPRSTFHALIVAIAFTIIFITLQLNVEGLIDGILVGSEEDQFSGSIEGPIRMANIDNNNPLNSAENILRKNREPIKVNLFDSQNFRYGVKQTDCNTEQYKTEHRRSKNNNKNVSRSFRRRLGKKRRGSFKELFKNNSSKKHNYGRWG